MATGYAVALGPALLGLVFLRAGPVRMIPEELVRVVGTGRVAKVSDTYRPIGDQPDDRWSCVRYSVGIPTGAFGGFISPPSGRTRWRPATSQPRRQAAEEFFRASTSAERRRDPRRVHVRYVVVSSDDDVRRRNQTQV
jgi:hypothetical protein